MELAIAITSTCIHYCGGCQRLSAVNRPQPPIYFAFLCYMCMCLWVRMCECMCQCPCKCMSMRVRMGFVCMRMAACVFMCSFVCACTCVCECVFCMCSVCVCLSARTRVCVCVCVCLCVHTYVCTRTGRFGYNLVCPFSDVSSQCIQSNVHHLSLSFCFHITCMYDRSVAPKGKML